MVSQVSCRINHVPRKFYARFGGARKGHFVVQREGSISVGFTKLGTRKVRNDCPAGRGQVVIFLFLWFRCG